MIITGGLDDKNKRISDQCIEVSRNMYAKKRCSMPEPRYAHAQVIVKQSLYVTGGINDLMHEMGMRNIPIGKSECYRYNLTAD